MDAVLTARVSAEVASAKAGIQSVQAELAKLSKGAGEASAAGKTLGSSLLIPPPVVQQTTGVQAELARLTKGAGDASAAGKMLGTSLMIPPPVALKTMVPTLSDISLALDRSLQSTTALAGAQTALQSSSQAVTVNMAELAGIETKVSAATEQEINDLVRLSAEVDQVRQRVAPAITAKEMLAEATQKVDAAIQAGLITQREANAIADQARAKFQPLIDAQAKAEKGAFAAAGGARMLGQQLSQVFQQGAATGNYLQAFAIQLPDIALGFGNIAIVASIVATVVLPMIISAFGGGKTAAEQLQDQIDELTSSITALTTAEEAAHEPMDLLVEKYGALARAVREARLQLADNAFEKAKKDLDGLVAASNIGPVMPLADVLGLNDTLLAINQIRLKMDGARASAEANNTFYDDTADSAALAALVNKAQGVATYIGALRDQFKLSQDQAASLAEALSRLGDAKSAKDQVVAAEALKSKLIEIFGSAKAADAATEGMVTALSNAIEKGAELASVTGQISGKISSGTRAGEILKQTLQMAKDEAQALSAVNVGAGISAALGPASALAAKLWDAAVAAANIHAGEQVKRIPGGVDAIASGDIQMSGGNFHRPIVYKPPGSGSGSGGGGGDARETLASLSDESKKVLADLDVALAAINEKVKAGLISAADATKAISEAKDKANDDLTLIIAKISQMGPAGEAAAKELRTHLLSATDAMAKSMADLSKSMGDNFKSSFVDAIMGSKDAFSGFLQFMERKLLEMSYDKYLAGSVNSLLDGFIGGIGGLFTKMVPHAKGGVPEGADLSAHRNQVLDKPTLFPMRAGVGLMAEAGPEAILPVSGGGILAIMGGRETRLPLTRGADGRLGVTVPETEMAEAPGAPKAFAKGGVPDLPQDGAVPAAPPPLSVHRNQVLDKPTLFPMRAGVGLMAEAGPEAILPVSGGGILAIMGGRETRLPLTRGADGRLGVEAPNWTSGADRAPQVFAKGALFASGQESRVEAASSAGSPAPESPKVAVNITTPPGHTAQVKERMDGGTLNLDVMVEAIEARIAGNLRTGRGAMNGAISDSFGLPRATR